MADSWSGLGAVDEVEPALSVRLNLYVKSLVHKSHRKLMKLSGGLAWDSLRDEVIRGVLRAI